MKNIKDVYHDIQWKMQSKPCLCVHDESDEEKYKMYIAKKRQYLYKLPYQKEFSEFETNIDKWLDSIPLASHPDWEKIWLEKFIACDRLIASAKTKGEVDRFQSLKDLYAFHKVSMEEMHKEHQAELAKRCHCPKHRNSD